MEAEAILTAEFQGTDLRKERKNPLIQFSCRETQELREKRLHQALHQNLHHLEHDVWKFMKSYGEGEGGAEPYNYRVLTAYDRFCEPPKKSSRR